MVDSAVTVADLEVVISYRTEGSIDRETKKAKRALQNIGASAKQGEKDTNKFFASIKRIAGYRLLRTALKAVAASFREGAMNALQWEKVTGNSRYLTIMSTLNGKLLELKNSLGSMVLPLLGAVTPIITFLSDILIKIANIINQIISALAGSKTYTKANTLANYDYAKSISAVKRQLMGFDELNVLSDNSTTNGGINYSEMFSQESLAGGLGGVANFFSEANKIIKDSMGEIKIAMLAVPLALGGLMLLMGEVPLGLKLIGMGVLGYVAAAAIDTQLLPNMIGGILDNISKLFVVAGFGMAAVGLLICLMGGAGNLGLGIGLLAAGVATFVGAITLGDPTNEIQKRLTGLTVMLGASLLAIGALMFFFGGSPTVQAKGLGLMFAGSASLASAIAINWDAITGAFKAAIDKVKEMIQSAISWYESTSLYKWLHGGDVERYNQIKTSEGLGYGLGYGYMYGGNYANGGFPSQGSMFIAGETGDPEFVGNVGGRTAVYNSDQLAGSLAVANESVVNAIYQAVNSINGAIANQPVPSIKIGDREIYRASQRGQRALGGNLVQGV